MRPTPTQTPVFHLLAGPNGAGKSTLYRALVKSGILGAGLVFVNADIHEREQLRHIADPRERSQAARDWADAQRALQLARGESFVSETVFSHASKLALIEEALARGYVVALYIVALDDPQRLLARVRRRVQEGGHDVPPAKTRRRRAAAGGDASGRESDGFCQAAAAVGARGAGEVEYDMFKAGKKAWEHYYRQGHATGFIAISLLYSLHKPENCFFKTSLDLENVHFTPCYFDNRIAGNLCRTVCAND